MNLRWVAGTLLAFFYNQLIGKFPSRKLREFYLRNWLGSFGRRCGVQLGCRFFNGRKIRLGEGTVINHGTVLDGRRYSIRTGKNVSIGPDAVILTLGHEPQSPDFELRGGDVTIGDYAWIGYRTLILPGLTIGEGAVVGAGSVVTKNVAPYKIVAGNPAREIGTRNSDMRYELNFRPFLE